jgi:hypothetical protein
VVDDPAFGSCCGDDRPERGRSRSLFAIFWGLETRRVARVRANNVKKPDPDRGPLREPYRTTVGEQSIKAEQAREPARQK